MRQKDALTVLLTGRSESNFSALIKRMLVAKKLDPDMVVLKPAVGPNNEQLGSTMKFKLTFFETLMETYRHAEDIRVYEDRPRHVKDFREFFMGWNTAKHAQDAAAKEGRGPITAEVIQVADASTQLDPVVETAEVQSLINDHNATVSMTKRGTRYQIKKTVFYTGYLIDEKDTQALVALAQIPSSVKDQDLKFLANNILITPRPSPQSILEKVGGLGAKCTWEAHASAVFEHKIWACQVRPVSPNAKVYTENTTPMVVIALRKGTRPMDANRIQNWQPLPKDKMLRFETTVGEKVLLRIEQEDLEEDGYESLFANKSFKRKHDGSEEGRPVVRRVAENSYSGGSPKHRGGGTSSARGGGYENRGRGRGRDVSRGGRGGNRGGIGNARGNGRGGRGAGNSHGYGSRPHEDGADRNNGNNHRHPRSSVNGLGGDGQNDAYDPTVTYEDFPPLQKQYQTPQQLVQQQFEQYQAFQQQQAITSRQGKGRGSGNSDSDGRAAGSGRNAGNANIELQYF